MASIFSKGIAQIERPANSGRKVRLSALGYLVAVGEGVGALALVATKDVRKIAEYISRNKLSFCGEGANVYAELRARGELV